MKDKLTDERLKEMIEAIKIFADMPYGVQINEINPKDIYEAFLELQERRKFKLDELIENLELLGSHFDGEELSCAGHEGLRMLRDIIDAAEYGTSEIDY